MEPLSCAVLVEEGVLQSGSGYCVERFSDLDGLYADEPALGGFCAEIGSEVVWEVGEVRPTRAASDVIFGVTRMALGRVAEVHPQTICYLPSFWVRRPVNTGDGDHGSNAPDFRLRGKPYAHGILAGLVGQGHPTPTKSPILRTSSLPTAD